MSTLPDVRARNADGLARIFRYFGEVETPALQSVVYTAYSLGIAEDLELRELASWVDPGQPAPNVFYAAVQDLLLEAPEASEEARALARFYPAISHAPIPDDTPWPAFRRFCLAHADALEPRLRTGRTQTCVVHRCAVVLPSLAALPRIREAEGRVGLLEIGPSAGLNLRLDRYRYEYAGANAGSLEWGEVGALPLLGCALRGDQTPSLPTALEVVARRGLDLNPLDLSQPSQIRWLKALIWPEHVERARVMDEALAVAASVPVSIEAGDAAREIASQIAKLPPDAARVVFATHVVYQMSREAVREMTDQIALASEAVPIDLLIMDSTGQGDSRVDWLHFAAGERRQCAVLAHADSHGRWIEWGRGAA